MKKRFHCPFFLAAVFMLMLSPLSAATVADYAFTGDLSVTALGLPDGTTAIGEGAYAGTGVKTADIPQGLTKIGQYAFADCRSLIRAAIPEGVTVIPKGLFRGCKSLREVELPSSLESIEADAFAATAIEDIDLSHCKKLRHIGDRCFASCDKLGKIYLPASVDSIGDAALFGCATLTEIDLPESLHSIGDFSLACTAGVTGIKLPSPLSYIGSGAMEGMTRLSRIDATGVDDVPQLGENVWHGLPQQDIRLIVSPDFSERFMSSPQWRDFNITLATEASATFPVTAQIKSVTVYRVSEIDIIVTVYDDGSRRVEKILNIK